MWTGAIIAVLYLTGISSALVYGLAVAYRTKDSHLPAVRRPAKRAGRMRRNRTLVVRETDGRIVFLSETIEEV